jgi:hypothetical protein
MAAPKHNEFAKRDYEPIIGTELMNHVRNPGPNGVGHNQPDPLRHLDDKYVPKYQ